MFLLLKITNLRARAFLDEGAHSAGTLKPSPFLPLLQALCQGKQSSFAKHKLFIRKPLKKLTNFAPLKLKGDKKRFFS
ncbi:MAG: hypothetical protein D6797_02000 [Bdellovibrio sp.]|nr:MAG: hypothetical protein D6797_02000 [Bdellovibrio sp.]